jgi:hypothetical protein
MMEVAEKILLVIDQKDRSWKTFRSIAKNYGPLKTLMGSVTIEQISEELMTDLLPIWKGKTGMA